MNKKEICETAYNLICGLSDIDDEYDDDLE